MAIVNIELLRVNHLISFPHIFLDQIFGDQERYAEVRRDALAWLSKNKDYCVDDDNTATISAFCDTDWDLYISKMRKDFAWGDQITLTAIAEAFQISIH